MKKSRVWFTHILVCLVIILLVACNLPSDVPVSPTAFFPTFLPSLSPVPKDLLPTSTSTLQPPLTTTTTVIPTNTSIPIPCNRAEFAGDVSIPDGMQIASGASYTKIWRLRNTGSCTWTSGYVLLFDHGDRMDAPAVQPLTSGSVPPGAIVEVSITLKAPSTPGTYESHFRLRSSESILFGIGPIGQGSFWVKIVVPQSTATPTKTLIPPDFDAIVNYAAGGGGAGCGVVYPGYQPAIEILQSLDNLQICIWGASFGVPFSLKFTAPNGAIINPIKLLVDNNTLNIEWEGYGEPDSFASRGEEATLMAFNAWIPITFPTGQWKIQASGPFQVESDFLIEGRDNPPYIAAVNPSYGSEFLPIDNVFLGEHLLKLNENGRINVIGTDFPANIPIYIVLYRRGVEFQYSLVNTQTVYTNFLGTVFTELSAEVNVGQSYLLVGVMDPHTDMTPENNGEFDKNLTHDLFKPVSP